MKRGSSQLSHGVMEPIINPWHTVLSLQEVFWFQGFILCSLIEGCDMYTIHPLYTTYTHHPQFVILRLGSIILHLPSTIFHPSSASNICPPSSSVHHPLISIHHLPPSSTICSCHYLEPSLLLHAPLFRQISCTTIWPVQVKLTIVRDPENC